MSAGVALLLIFAALGLAIIVLLWRIFVVGGELRREAQHGKAARDIARRVDMSLTELLEVVDELRRRKTGPETSEASMKASADALERYAMEAEAVDRHAAGGPGLKPEIERAQRALDLIEHGRELLLLPGPESNGEGESSVKRGYLNLLHAREAIKARADEIAAAATAPPGADPRWLGRKH